MLPEFPLFILTKDEMSIHMVNSSKELSFCERIDIEEGLYEGWDVKGHPIKILWDSKYGPKAKNIQESIQSDKLREAILNYAKHYRSKVPFVYSGSGDDMVELFKATERHIQEDG